MRGRGSSGDSGLPSMSRVLGLLLIIITIFALALAIYPVAGAVPWISLTAAVVAGFLGYLLLQMREGYRVVDLIEGRSDPIDAYERMSKHFGLRGFLHTTNITGMPFATIAMTMTFCVLALLSHIVNAIAAANEASGDVIPKEFPQAVLELAKLTLGAFIGSFVSKVSSANERLEPPRASGTRSST